jgi:hypothetical protein
MASSSKQQLIVGLVTGTLRNTELEYRSNVRFGSKAALTAPKRDFWSAPNNGHRPTGSACLKGARTGSCRTPYLTISRRIAQVGTGRTVSLDDLVGRCQQRLRNG